MAIKLPPDGSKKRKKLLKQALKDLGIPAVPPTPVHVELFDHVSEPLGPLFEGENKCPPGAICLNLTVIPSGFHFPPEGTEQTRFHPTGQMMDIPALGPVPEVRQVTNFVTTDVGKASVILKPSKVEPGPARNEPMDELNTTVPLDGPNVTAAEIAMARAEAKAMRKGGDPVPFKRFGLTHKEIMEMLKDPP